MDQGLVELKKSFMAEAEAAFDRMMLQDQEQMLTFTQIEQRAVELSRKYGSNLIQRRLKYRGESGGVCCPRCRGAAEPFAKSGEVRSVESLTGPIEFERRKFRCARCRIRFFPDGHRAKAGH